MLNSQEYYDPNFFLLLGRLVNGEQENGEKKKWKIYGSNHFLKK